MATAYKQKTPNNLTRDNVAPLAAGSEAAPIIESLRAQAQSILGAVFTEPLSGFTVGALGNFPYYWQNPTNLKFNHLTYGWISSNLMANTTPAQLDQSFVNLYIEALGSVSYQLSTADQAQLTKAQQNATNQQAALLNAWQSAYGSLPPATGTQQPIDVIMTTIATQWASPATTLSAIQSSKNLNALLNNMPASGKPIAPVLAQYLNALGSSISLQNATTMNTGYVQQALLAAQSPGSATGGVTTDDGITHPAYAVSTQLADILNGLQNASNQVKLEMAVSRYSQSEYQVSVSGGTGFQIPILDFFTVGIGGNASYFEDQIAISSNTVSVEMTFPGVTSVNYGPSTFDMATGQNWFWTEPITDAIKNADKDVSGFKFSPVPQIDFSENGPFGYLTGVAISTYPTVEITVTSSDYQSIAQTFQQTTSVSVSFLGIPLGSSTESTYSHSVSVNSAEQSVTITLNPPPQTVSGSAVSSTAWVLGVETNYPAA